MEIHEHRALDIRADGEDIVEIELKNTPVGQEVLYVNINGICRFRAVKEQGQFILTDERRKKAVTIGPKRYVFKHLTMECYFAGFERGNVSTNLTWTENIRNAVYYDQQQYDRLCKSTSSASSKLFDNAKAIEAP